MGTPHRELDGICALRPAGPQDQVGGVAGSVVATPATTEEVSALLAACHRQRLRVVTRGHGTKIGWGRPPEALDVILETTRLTGPVEHSRGDLIATAGAGTPLARLQEVVGQAGHQLVVDDLVATAGGPGSTLGGAVATNLAGPRRLWTGALRDLVIGVRLVRADGTVAKAGGKVVKNVAGYDLAKLLTGSFGTLAVLTEVTVRLHPQPRAARWVGGHLAPDRLAPVLAGLHRSQLALHGLEVRAVPGGAVEVSALLTGTAAGVGPRATALVEEAPDLAVGTSAPPWWGVLPGATGRTLLRTTARLSGVAELVEVATRHGLEVTGSAGVGVLHAASADVDDGGGAGASADVTAAAVDAVRAASVRLGGSTVVLEAPAEVRARVDTWGPVPGLALMGRVKAEFDPRRVLSPGRFVGGL
ncbi:FAD-binding oxidoreductase [Serinicoccus sp. LYQ131]|uniref:FAD-binding oxidoreductase n=1 Tax=Serinicoccus sp. LYQ131 TaxID=3378797 RepID=UPI003852E168